MNELSLAGSGGVSSFGATEVTFKDVIQSQKLKRFPSMNEAEKALIAFIAIDDQGNPRARNTQIHWLSVKNGDAQNIMIQAPDPKKNPKLAKACVQAFGEPKIRFATLIFRYATDPNGRFLSKKVEGQIYSYAFGIDKWELFQQMHLSWGLGTKDVVLVCTGKEYQKISPAINNSNYWQDPIHMLPEVTAGIKAEVSVLWDYLDQDLGRVLTDVQIEGLLKGISLDKQRTMAVSGVSQTTPFVGDKNLNPFTADVSQIPASGAPSPLPLGSISETKDVLGVAPESVPASSPEAGTETDISSLENLKSPTGPDFSMLVNNDESPKVQDQPSSIGPFSNPGPDFSMLVNNDESPKVQDQPSSIGPFSNPG